MERKEQLEKYLRDFTEDVFRDFLVNFFKFCGGQAMNIHGSNEHGVDIYVKIPNDKDILGRENILLVQAKVGNIGMSAWRISVNFFL